MTTSWSARTSASAATSTSTADSGSTSGSGSGSGSGESAVAAAGPLPPELLRRAFRGHPAGVVVITVDGGHGPAGFTATSLISLSLEPPLVSFAISTTASSWPHVRDSATAVVHFLGAGHEALARRFATSGIDRFAGPTGFSLLPGGEPLLHGVESWLLIEVQERIAAGDHQLVIGRVTRAGLDEDHRPLVYHDGSYHSV